MQRLPQPFQFSQQTKSVIRKIFTKRRKQIFAIVRNEDPVFQQWMADNAIDKNMRPEQISIKQWQNLDTFFKPAQ